MVTHMLAATTHQTPLRSSHDFKCNANLVPCLLQQLQVEGGFVNLQAASLQHVSPKTDF